MFHINRIPVFFIPPSFTLLHWLLDATVYENILRECTPDLRSTIQFVVYIAYKYAPHGIYETVFFIVPSRKHLVKMYKVLVPLVFIVVIVAADDLGMKYVMRMYEDCQRTDGILPCLKKKAILFFDRAARMEAIPLIDGVDIVKNSNMEIVPVSENDIDASLPRNMESKDEALTEMLWNRIAAFANSRTIQLSLPKMTGQELNKGVEEGNTNSLVYSLTYYNHLDNEHSYLY